MKGKSLFKKIGAIATTAAMLASVGVTGFAAGTVEYNGTAPSVIVGTETKDATGIGTGIYEVKIPYKEVNSNNTIGVTMLAYAQENHSSITNKDTAYTSAMKIVGVDQINAVDKARTPEFTFYVDTNKTTSAEWSSATNSGVIRMNKGETGVVLLSGDDATAPTGYLFMAAKDTATAYLYNGGVQGDAVTEATELLAATPTLDADAITLAKEAIASKVKLVPDSNTNTSIAIDKEDITDINATANAYNANSRKEQTTTYSVTVSTDTCEAVTFSINVTYAANPVTVKNTVTMEKFSVNDPTNAMDQTAFVTAVNTALVDKTVKFADSADVVVPYVVTAADLAGETPKIKAELASGETFEAATTKTYKFNLTVAEGGYDGETITVPAGGAIGTVEVTLTSVDKWTVDSAEALNAEGAKVESGTIQLTETLTATTGADVIKTITDQIASYKVYNDDKSKDETTGWTVSTWTVTDSEGADKTTATDLGAGTYTVTGTVANASSAFAEGTAPVTFTVTVKAAAPAYILGDVDGDGSVLPNDGTVLLQYLGGVPGVVLEGSTLLAADVDGDGSVLPNDGTVLLQYLGGVPGVELGK